MIGEEQLDLVEGVALPPAEADEEGDRPGGGREPRRLGVEADERDARWRLARQTGQADAIERDLAWLGRAADDEAAGHRDHLATDRPGEALGQDTAVDRGVGQLDLAGRLERRAGAAVGRRPVAVEPPCQARPIGDGTRHPATGRTDMPRGAPSSTRSRRARARASTPGSSRGPVHDGQPPSQPHASINSAAAARSSSCRSQRRSESPIPPGTASYR